jgi:replicative DNA helicase
VVEKKLKGSLEENVLTALAFNEQQAPNIQFKLNPDLFSTRAYKTIAKSAIAHLESYGVPPRLHLYDRLENELRRGEEGILLRKTLDQMKMLADELQIDYVMQELDHFISKRQLLNAIEAASDLAQNDDLTKAREALYQMESKSEDSHGVWLSDPEGMLSFLDERDEDYFSSGIEALDDLGIRPARGELFMLMAPAKRGKSWSLVEMAKHNLMIRKNILHVTLENSQKMTSQRYVQNFFAMTRRKMRNTKMPIFTRDEQGRCSSVDLIDLEETQKLPEILNKDSKAKLAKRLRAFTNRARLMIKMFPTGQLTTAGLNAYLDYLERTENFKPDLLIVDYVNLMQLDRKNIRTEVGRATVELRGIATTRNIAVATVTQGNRESSNSKTVSKTQVAEDWSMIGTVDTFLTYSQTPAERKVNLARIFVDAARNERDGFIVLISQSYESGQFCLDSVYMNEHAEEAHERLTGNGKGDHKDD